MRYILLLLKKPHLFISIFIFLILYSLPLYADELRGQDIFLADCVGCHAVKSSEEKESLEAILERRAPTLLYAGSKFKKEFLLNWLQEPKPIRPLAFNSLSEPNPANHMRLNPLDAKDMVSYLMTLRSADMVPLGLKGEDNLLGKQIFSQRYSCYGCHRVTGETKSGLTGGLSGPSLVNAGSRLNPDWIFAYLSGPTSFKPRGAMPVYAGIISDDHLKELTKYIASFK
jgi:mono/diheme cytochrome c family protein